MHVIVGASRSHLAPCLRPHQAAAERWERARQSSRSSIFARSQVQRHDSLLIIPAHSSEQSHGRGGRTSAS